MNQHGDGLTQCWCVNMRMAVFSIRKQIVLRSLLLLPALVCSCLLLSALACSCLLLPALVCSCLLLPALVCSCLLLSALVCSCLLLPALVCSCLLLSALACSCLLCFLLHLNGCHHFGAACVELTSSFALSASHNIYTSRFCTPSEHTGSCHLAVGPSGQAAFRKIVSPNCNTFPRGSAPPMSTSAAAIWQSVHPVS